MNTIHKQTMGLRWINRKQIEDLLWTATRTRKFRKKRKGVQVRASNLIKWSTPGHGMTWREKYNCCVFISEAG